MSPGFVEPEVYTTEEGVRGRESLFKEKNAKSQIWNLIQDLGKGLI